jgi:hypothetical protein
VLPGRQYVPFVRSPGFEILLEFLQNGLGITMALPAEAVEHTRTASEKVFMSRSNVRDPVFERKLANEEHADYTRLEKDREQYFAKPEERAIEFEPRSCRIVNEDVFRLTVDLGSDACVDF